MTPINFGLRPLGRAVRKAISAVTFLFRDDFTTNESAPITSPRTAEPTGKALITDVGNNLSISNSNLVCSGGEGNWTQTIYQGRDGDSLEWERVSGLCAYFRISYSSGQTIVGWEHFGTFSYGVFFVNSTLTHYRDGNTNNAIDTFLVDVFGKVFSILRNVGCFIIVENTLSWVGANATGDPLQPSFLNNTGVWLSDDISVSQLPAPWDTDYGIATDRLAGSQSQGTTYIHEADCLIEYTVTTLDHIQVDFRSVDPDNTWRVKISASGSGVINLLERVGGVDTFRANSTGVSNGSRVVVIAEDELIKVYVDNVLKLTYAFASNFKTATAGEVRLILGVGVISDIISWPRTLSGDAKDALDAVADA